MPIWRPEAYQGARRRRRYFEGWYFKHVTAGMEESWSFIPGISRGESRGEGYAFVQAIEGNSGRTWWFQTDLESFAASESELLVRVGDSEFSPRGARIRLSSEEVSLTGDFAYRGFHGPIIKLLSPGIMGPYAFAPFMECKHGLVSLDHGIDGRLLLVEPGARGAAPSSREIDFSGGRGYAEKDWGSSMPESWIWTQSNNFPRAGDSFMLSVARVPWLASSFTGFLCVGSLGGAELREATYTGARLSKLAITERLVSLAIDRATDRIEIEVERSRGGELRAPLRGQLSRRIAESVDATLRVRWIKAGVLVFEGQAHKAGLEVVGEVNALLPS